MKPLLLVATITMWSLTAALVSAQPPVPGGQPTASPYLNLVRPGTPSGINYVGLVRPQIEFNSSIQLLQQQTRTNRQGLSSLEQSVAGPNTVPPPTGFVPQFQSQAGYFMTFSSGAAGAQVPNRGTGRVGAVLPRAMGVPALGSPTLGAPSMGAPRSR
jgi:hypothetical protein